MKQGKSPTTPHLESLRHTSESPTTPHLESLRHTSESPHVLAPHGGCQPVHCVVGTANYFLLRLEGDNADNRAFREAGGRRGQRKERGGRVRRGGEEKWRG